MKLDSVQVAKAKEWLDTVNDQLEKKGAVRALGLKVVKNENGEEEYFFIFDLPQYGIHVATGEAKKAK